MAAEIEPGAEAEAPRGRSWWGWLVGLLLLVVLALAAAVPAGLWWLAETPAGRAFVAARVSGIEPASGIRYEVGRIDGSLLSRFVLRDVVVRDLKGPLALIPEARVDWEPISLVRRTVSINRLDVPEVRLLRMWELNPRDPDEPLLPDIDIRVGRFTFDRVVLDQPVLGRAEELAAVGRADIRSGRVLMDLQLRAAAGDRLLLMVDAEPDRDRFDIEADLRAPVGGLVVTAAGLAEPLVVKADGAGSWQRWRGRVTATLGSVQAGQPLADLQLAADDGRFRLLGEVAPAPLLPEGPVRALVTPALSVDATAARDGDWYQLAFAAGSPGLALKGDGRIDPTDNRLDAVKLTAVLRRPQLLNPALSGTGMVATVAAEGPLADPAIRWTAKADTLRWAGAGGAVGADGLVATGSVRLVDGRPAAIPFDARLARTVGLPPETAALLARPRLTGTLLLADGGLKADGLVLRTASLTAKGTGVLAADGRATARVQADVPRLAVPGLGTIRLTASADVLRPAGAARPSVSGRFDATALALSNAQAREFLGGLPRAGGRFALAPDGRIAVTELSVAAPRLSVAGGRADYDPASGRFALDLSGRTAAYGPFSLVASGTSTAPTATLKMPAPGLGFGVTDLVARVTPATGGVRVVAEGATPQGPFEARVGVGFGAGRPLSLDIEQASIAGLEARGRLVQTPAGPFAGRLVVDGRGLDAELLFASDGGVQRVSGDAQALNARIPLETPVGIAKGSARFDVRLVPGAPEIRGSFAAENVSRDTLVLTRVSGAANLVGPRGVATFSGAGRAGDGQPVTLAGRVQSAPDGYAIQVDGRVGKLPLKLAQPARVVRTDDGWRLLPVALELPKGEVRIAGELGSARSLDLVLDDVDLSILDLVSDRFNLGGRASGRLSIRQGEGRVPVGEADLAITGLQRAALTGTTVPVDVRLVATSDGSGLVMGATLRLQKNDLGRLVLKVTPGPGATASERFENGQLSGGIRYNGPVEPLWALGGFDGQELKGPIAIAADFAGTPSAPTLAGIARGKGLIYRNATFGTEIVDLGFDGRFTGDELRIESVTGRANGGTLSGSGVVRLGLEQSIDLSLDLQRARLANSDKLEFTLSGPLRLQGTGRKATLSGDLRVDSARVQLVQVETSEIPTLQVRRAGEVRTAEPEPSISLGNLGLDIRVRADDRVQVEGMGLESVWRGDIRVRGTATQPQFIGVATLARGEFSFAGNSFELTSGRVGFNGRPLDSSLNIVAQTRAEDVTAIVTISGTAGKPDIQFSSSPSLPQDEILARLLFGSSVADLSVTEAVQLATAVAGLQSGTDTMGKLRRSVGVDRLRIVGDNAETGMGTGLAIGKRLSRNVYVEVLTDSQGNTLTTLQLTLSRIWSLFVEVSSLGESSVNLRYQQER